MYSIVFPISKGCRAAYTEMLALAGSGHFISLRKDNNMNKSIGRGLAAAVLAAPLCVAAAPVSWVDWSNFSGTFTQNAQPITVTYTGDANGVSHADYFTAYDSAYLSSEVDNGPADNGFLWFDGGTTQVHHLHFSSAVTNPYLALISLGQTGVEATFDFSNVTSIDLISEGSGQYGNGTLTVSGGVVAGREGHGVVRLNGTFTDLYFTTPVYEYWYGAALGVPVTAVPEPGTWAMLLAGGVMLGLLGRRGRSDTFSRPA